MSFNSLKIAELREVANDFAVDLGDVTGKAAIIKEIEENGVTWDMVAAESKSKAPAEEVSDEPVVPSGPQIVVRMDRQNAVYEILGVRFTKEHPFAAVSEEIADAIFDSEEGFRPATPRELREYYS